MTVTLQDVLEIENDPFFAECVCPSTGVLVWPPIRNVFLRLIMSDWFYSSQLIDGVRRPPALRAGKAAVLTTLHNLTHPPRRSSVLIHASGAGLENHNGLSRNRYTRYFAESLGTDAWSLEGLSECKWPLPRDGGRLSFSFPGLATIAAYSRMRTARAARRIAEEIVELAVQRAEDLFDWRLGDARREWLTKVAARVITAYPLKRKWTTRWLEKVQPRLMLVEEGCYGHMAVLNATAREYGVTVAEYQHGVVTAGHDVYNVASALQGSENFRRTLPAYFLGYGAWWNRQFNAPTRKVVIGNPHREEVLEHQRFERKQERMILVLGLGAETSSYFDSCRELSGLLPSGYRVVFRPHPLERSAVFASMAGAERGFEIDREPDIYSSLARADTVVGELSTGLFEAVGLARRILLWNTSKSRFALPDHPFAGFDSVPDLARMILEDRTVGVLAGEAPDELWASGWRERFSDFIKVALEGGDPSVETAFQESEHER